MLPQPLEFKVFIFNVTNANDIHKGATPIVKELGPYVYKYSVLTSLHFILLICIFKRQYRIKNVEKFSKDQMDITYTVKQVFKFDRQSSYPRRENDNIVVLNTAMNVSLVLILLNEEHRVKKPKIGWT